MFGQLWCHSFLATTNTFDITEWDQIPSNQWCKESGWTVSNHIPGPPQLMMTHNVTCNHSKIDADFGIDIDIGKTWMHSADRVETDWENLDMLYWSCVGSTCAWKKLNANLRTCSQGQEIRAWELAQCLTAWHWQLSCWDLLELSLGGGCVGHPWVVSRVHFHQ